MHRLFSIAALLVAGSVLVLAWRHGAFVAAGADAYGYVSQAQLWVDGRLRVAQPAALELPRVIRDEALAPLGYRAARIVGLPGGLVPTYSPGLPILMAGASIAGGPDAVYVVVPLLSAVGVWLAYVLGLRLHSGNAGLLAAVALASSPTWLSHTFVPMSDVPVSTWWLLSLVLAAGRSPTSAAGAGLATSLAVITRPNVVVLAVPLFAGFVVHWWRTGRRAPASTRLVAYCAVAALGPLAIAFLNDYLYKSPFTSGYGSLADIYAWNFVRPNLERYTRWLVETETPLSLLAPFAWWCLPATPAVPSPAALGWPPRLIVVVACGMIATNVAAYLPYLPFEDWSYLRFLLPSYPLLFTLGSTVVAYASTRLAKGWYWIPVAGIAALVVYQGSATMARHGTWHWREGFERYRTVGTYLADRLPPRAVVFAMEHSGSIRHYAGRLTIRYDMLEPDELDEAVAGLVERGFEPYLLLESWEEDEFHEHFEAASRFASLNWPPDKHFDLQPQIRLYRLSGQRQ